MFLFFVFVADPFSNHKVMVCYLNIVEGVKKSSCAEKHGF